MNLEEMLRETDALTYINSLKVTQTEIKDELSKIDEMQGYITQGCERVRKLMRKADNQYRVIAKLVQKEGPFATDVVVEENMEDLEELMENV